MSIEKRKNDHIVTCMNQFVESDAMTGLENYRLIHHACPNADFDQIDVKTDFLGKTIRFPLLISSMTGGTKDGERVNAHLSEAAQQMQIPLCLGSMRIFLETKQWKSLRSIRKKAPDIPVLANIGAVQLNYGVTFDDLLQIIDSVEANALIFHFNVLQELFQQNGNHNFSGLLAKIEQIAHKISIPIIAKEVGFGFSVDDAYQLIQAGFSWIDIAGAGGANWAKIETYLDDDAKISAQRHPFGAWGIPTAESLIKIHHQFPHVSLIASGGIRDGVDIYKACLLGAKLCGIALPFLMPAIHSADEVCALIEKYEKEFKIAKFVSSGIEKISG